MSPLLLRAFVNERLTRAAEEIFQVFERTIAKYEEEACSSKQEIERLRALLPGLGSKQRAAAVACSPVCTGEALGEQQHCEQELSLSDRQGDPEPRHIKEEDRELWAAEQEDIERADVEADALGPPHSFVWEENGQEDAKPLLPAPKEHCESLHGSQETQKAGKQTKQIPLHLSSSLSSHDEGVQSGREDKGTAAVFISDQTQEEPGRASSFPCAESTDFSGPKVGHRCHLCSKSFSSSHRLINHAFRFHSKDAGVTCAVCGGAFESTESLDAHLGSHKISKCCHVCGKHCTSTTALTEHMAGHAGVKLHRCPVCGKECSRKGDLKIHMRIHTGEKPFCCSFCCKGFTHSGHLRKHMRSHTGERPHRCQLCGRGFLQSTHLKYHLGTHAQKR
ncbi:uncharacterized protein ACNS7B_018150 [Menidia menidia]